MNDSINKTKEFFQNNTKADALKVIRGIINLFEGKIEEEANDTVEIKALLEKHEKANYDERLSIFNEIRIKFSNAFKRYQETCRKK